MLILSPDKVTFAGEPWREVASVSIERAAEKSVLEWSDNGPHAVYGDVPEERMTLRVVRVLSESELDGPAPGALGELVLFTSNGASDGRRRRLRALGVIERIAYQYVQKSGATQTITLLAVSPAGDVCPLTIEPA
ncbi:MAG: hypothetical protein IT439_02695 [Phycisphaerales bacterium]|nr:hypothetical protein [Phycisphaerales bacterium]